MTKNKLLTKNHCSKFNSYFINLGSKPLAKISSSNTNFESNYPNITTSILEKPLKEKELKDAFFALKSPDYDKLCINVMRKLYHLLKVPLMIIFSLSLKTRSFPEKLMFLQYLRNMVSQFFQTIDQSPFFHIFQKFQKFRNVQCKTENSILFNKQFGFRTGHSMEHTLLEVIDQINYSFNDKWPWCFLQFIESFWCCGS